MCVVIDKGLWDLWVKKAVEEIVLIFLEMALRKNHKPHPFGLIF